MNFAKSSPPNDGTAASVEHLFRHSAGRMTAVLARAFGLERYDLIEDAIQDSMIKALKTWPFAGIPENPQAWLIAVARNLVIDRLRRDRRSEPIGDLDRESEESFDIKFKDELDEDVLRMMFACCDPRISPDSQVALTLRAVGGFSVREIAAAFLSKEDSIAKLLTRAKKRLRDSELAIPPPNEIVGRLEPVLKVLYLMFNEGYSTSAGESAIRKDLCDEALRLARILASHPRTRSPRVHALAALLCFQSSRADARFDANGDILRLAEQDRNYWDRRLIAEGLAHLRACASGDELSVYHLEAEIASIHSVADDFGSTDWDRLLLCYDRLLERRASPVAALNRAIVIAQIEGPKAAIGELDTLAAKLGDYALFHITRGDLLSELGEAVEAADAFRTAGLLTGNSAMYRFLRRRLERKE